MEVSCNISDIKIQPFYKYFISVLDEYLQPESIVCQGDKVILSRGNIATITGKPKSYKTFLITAIIAGFMKDSFLSISGMGKTCLLIDTEQSKAHCNIVQRRVYRLCGWDLKEDNQKLIMLSLREQSADERLKCIKEAISYLHPDFVIIDGVRDLVRDFNDIKESAELVGLLMSISTKENCGIMTVLHQNKNDNNARGHLGSELCNKSETVLQVVREQSIATVSPVYSRNEEIEDFSFMIGVDGVPVSCAIPKVQRKNEELSDLMHKAMSGSSWLTKKELIKKVIRINSKTEKTAGRKINEAMERGILKFNPTGQYILNSKNDENWEN